MMPAGVQPLGELHAPVHPMSDPLTSPSASPTQRVSAWRWALLQTRRDLRSGSMRFLLVAVVLAVAALTAVAFFADRIERGLSRDAAQLLGGDAVVVGDQPVPAEFEAQAVQLGLRVARTSVLASMAGTKSESSRGRTTCVSGSPKRQLYSSTLGTPSRPIIRPA